jgi:hypothetical protein
VVGSKAQTPRNASRARFFEPASGSLIACRMSAERHLSRFASLPREVIPAPCEDSESCDFVARARAVADAQKDRGRASTAIRRDR